MPGTVAGVPVPSAEEDEFAEFPDVEPPLEALEAPPVELPPDVPPFDEELPLAPLEPAELPVLVCPEPWPEVAPPLPEVEPRDDPLEPLLDEPPVPPPPEAVEPSPACSAAAASASVLPFIAALAAAINLS